MLILIAYDVNTQDKPGTRRLRRIARACVDYGARVQKSLFECKVSQKDWAHLRFRLLSEADLSCDSLRFYFLDVDVAKNTEHHGIKAPPDPDGPLIV